MWADGYDFGPIIFANPFLQPIMSRGAGLPVASLQKLFSRSKTKSMIFTYFSSSYLVRDYP